MKIHYFLLGGELPTVQTVKFKAICNFTKTTKESASRRLKFSVLYLNKQTKAFLDLQQMLLTNMHTNECAHGHVCKHRLPHITVCLHTEVCVCVCFDWISIFLIASFQMNQALNALKQDLAPSYTCIHKTTVFNFIIQNTEKTEMHLLIARIDISSLKPF